MKLTSKETDTMNELDLAYAAGLIDGEGTVTLGKSHSSDCFRHPIVSMSSTTYELIDFLVINFGGKAVNHKVYKDHHKRSWGWFLHYDAAINFLTIVLPYMKEPAKISRAKMIVEKYKSLTNRNGRYTKDEIQAKLDFETAFFESIDSIGA